MPKLLWRHSDERTTWRVAKTRNAKALSKAKVKFKQDLGKSLDKLAKATAKTPASLQAAATQARAVLTLTRQIKKIVDAYRVDIDKLEPAAKKDLKKALDRIYKEAHKWEGGINQAEDNSQEEESESEGSSQPPQPTRRPKLSQAPIVRRQPTRRSLTKKSRDEKEQSGEEQEEEAPRTQRGSVPVDQPIPVSDLEESEYESEDDTPEQPEQPEPRQPVRRRAPRGQTLAPDTGGGVRVTGQIDGQTEDDQEEDEQPQPRPRRGTFGTRQDDDTGLEDQQEAEEAEETPSKPTPRDQNTIVGMETGGQSTSVENEGQPTERED